jgi:Carboxypeptidase regulatory-like domain
MGLTVVQFLLALQASGPASVAGIVRDGETDRPLANVTVQLTDLARSTLTDQSGHYLLRDVPAGPQHLTVRFIGYAPRTLDALVPRQGRLDINVVLRPRPVPLPPIVITTPLSPTGDQWHPFSLADRTTTVGDIRLNPLLAEPDILQSASGGDVVMDPEAPTGVHIRGGGSDQTSYLLDGIPVLSPYHVGGLFTAWNPDALAELELSTSSPSPALPETMSGTIAASTRTPGDRISVLGSVSTSQARLTLDGPLGAAGAGYLVSARTGFVPGFSSNMEASYLASEAFDVLAKLQVTALGGRFSLLGYHNQNEVNADAGGRTPNPRILRNDFAWESQSFGGEWRKPFSFGMVRLVAWSAASEADARWNGLGGVTDLSAVRRDLGGQFSLTMASAATSSVVGIRLERSRTLYEVSADSVPLSLPRLPARTVGTSLFGQHARSLGERLQLFAGAALTRYQDDLFLSPRGRILFKASRPISLFAAAARLHQFGQSLRNPESVVGYVFPVDLYVGAGNHGVPVARSDQFSVGIELAPTSGVRFEAQLYDRRLSGILLVAPGEPEPFSTQGFRAGEGSSSGVALRTSVNTRRIGLVASYGFQSISVEYGDSSFVPQHGARHLIEGGVIVFPTATSSIRLGGIGAFGRKTTTFAGHLEWEACNLLDQGCEFGGSPHYTGDPLGGTRLPSYFRVDLSLRKHWHIRLAGREAMLALFGTVTNLLGRRNLLTYSRDPTTGTRTAIEMRPLAPLVVGLDWRF